jgi:hypothetical protein
MSTLMQDSSGIWVDEEVSKISYPDKGNVDSFLLEDKSYWFIHRNNVIKGVIDRFPFFNNFADIGGGNGFQAKFISDNFSNSKVFLVEPGYQGCLNAKRRGLENVYNVLFQKFDFVKNEVKGVGLFDVLEHIQDDASFLNELKSKLPKGSYIYITVPAHKALWSDVDDYGGHFHRYNKKMVEQLTQKTQLELVYFSYFFMYLPILTFLLRRIPYLIRGRRNYEAIFEEEGQSHNPSKFILSIFNLFHKFELRKIKKSKINHGASCVIVFRT